MKNIAQFGSIQAPTGIRNISGGTAEGIPIILNIAIQSLIMIALIYAIFNLILAGYWYMSGAGEPKRVADASSKIWQTVIGMVVAGGALMIAGLIGQVFFGDAGAVLNVKIFTP